MTLNDVALANDFLINVGFYRLGFYWFHFEVNNRCAQCSHQFEEGLRFEDIVALYKFDKNLRSLLVCYLNDIEFALRTRLIHFVSNAHADTPCWMVDNRVVSVHIKQHIEAMYPSLSNNSVIKKHHRAHPNDRYAPAWKTIEYFTFGDLCQLYAGLLDNAMRIKIAQAFGVRNPKMMERYLHALRSLRNACAHGHNAYDIHLPKALPSHGALTIPPSYVQLIGGVIAVVQHFLDNMNRVEPPSFSQKLSTLIAEQPLFVKRHIAQFGLA